MNHTIRPAAYGKRLAGDRGSPGKLPSFCKSLGLDIVITGEGEAKLIELQHGFGRRGLYHLFPATNRAFRRISWDLRRRWGTSTFLNDRMRKICRDKIKTYRLFKDFQPSSLPFSLWSSRAERWLTGLKGDFVLAKPPHGSCGRGIKVLRRDALLREGSFNPGSGRVLLQEYVPSRPIPDTDGSPHLGCIRHIAVLFSDGDTLGHYHLPPYWRVSPVPFTGSPSREAFTANISSGAFPNAVTADEDHTVRRFSEEISRKMVRHILDIEELKEGPSRTICLDGGKRTTGASLPTGPR